MSQINPITASILQAPAAQRLADTDKTQQIRRTRDIRKNTATSNEAEVEESVTSTDEVQPSSDERQKNGQKKKAPYSRHPKPDSDKESDTDHLDLKA
jgi:hypothetical protein